MLFFDVQYVLMVLLPGLLISGAASWAVKSAFKRYSKVKSMKNYTGAQAAQLLLKGAGIHDVQIVSAHGFLSDHYNPSDKTLALSDSVANSTSLAAIGVATHEAGHAIQHATGYLPLGLRSALVPMAGIGSSLGYGMMFLGLFMSKYLVIAGAILFSLVLLFQLVTLPVEFNASSRAKQLVLEAGIIYPEERGGIASVLNAAALTYVAAVISTLLTLAYFLVRAGLLGSDD